jgi:hypothetical protein
MIFTNLLIQVFNLTIILRAQFASNACFLPPLALYGIDRAHAFEVERIRNNPISLVPPRF